MKKYKDVTKEYKCFIYKSYQYSIKDNFLEFQFEFLLDDKITFLPKSKIKLDPSFCLDNEILYEHLIFQIGMSEITSYWKSFCPKEIIIKAGYLNEAQLKWWTDLYFNGLGEFRYLNNISENKESFLKLSCSETKNKFSKINLSTHGNLIPIGGGKDSAVTLELLKDQKKENDCLVLNMNETRKNIIHVAGYDEKCILIERTIDSTLIDLNKKGYLNGHTPFSSVLGFYSLLAAAIYKKKYIILSNESSANEPTVIGTEINHQYSKSVEFEENFRNYIKNYITPDIEYFSLLRPLSELQISSIFSELEHFHGVFRSCNKGSYENKWCCNCPKCVFTYLMLTPFLSKQQLNRIFGEDIIDNENFITYMTELIGLSDTKPFECVGTVEESLIAFYIATQKNPDSFHGKKMFNQIVPKEMRNPYIEQNIAKFDSEHHIPEAFLLELKEAHNKAVDTISKIAYDYKLSKVFIS